MRSMIYDLDGRHIVHLKVPSTSLGKAGYQFYYDVLFEFVALSEDPMENSEILLFSNSPGFGYTYAHTYQFYGSKEENGQGLLFKLTRHNTATNSQLIKELVDKFPPKMITEPPTIRNPGQLALADRTVYYGLFFLLDNITPDQILHRAVRTSSARLIQAVSSFERMEMERKKLDDRRKKDRAREQKFTEGEFDTHERGLRRTNSVKKPIQAKRASAMKTTGGVRSPRSPRTTGTK